MAKYLYKIWQTVNDGYDTYDSAVVCAESEKQAQRTDPSGRRVWKNGAWYFQYTDGEEYKDSYDSWVSVKNVQVKKIGEANEDTELGIIVASFNAG